MRALLILAAGSSIADVQAGQPISPEGGECLVMVLYPNASHTPDEITPCLTVDQNTDAVFKGEATVHPPMTTASGHVECRWNEGLHLMYDFPELPKEDDTDRIPAYTQAFANNICNQLAKIYRKNYP